MQVKSQMIADILEPMYWFFKIKKERKKQIRKGFSEPLMNWFCVDVGLLIGNVCVN